MILFTLKNALTYSISYGILETIYRLVMTGTYSTIEQLIITFLWSPIIDLHFTKIDSTPIKILTFPINIWLCELVFGNILLYFNHRVWHYSDELSMFNGLITLSFTPYWILLGSCLYIYHSIWEIIAFLNYLRFIHLVEL